MNLECSEKSISETVRRALAAVICALLVVALAPSAEALRERPDRFGGTDGLIYSIVKARGRIYVAGNFTAARSPGGSFRPRGNLAAFDASSGRLTKWSPDADGTVYDLARSRGGGRIYAGGAFSTVNGKERRGLAALRSRSGSVVKRFRAHANNPVRALARSDSKLYLGGSFTRLTRGGNARRRLRLAAVGLTRGRISPAFGPKVNGTVKAFAPGQGGRIYVGGDFTQANGKDRRYLAAFTARSGRLSKEWTPSLRSVGPCGFGCIQDLAATKSQVYAGVGGRRRHGNSIHSFGAQKGRRVWSWKGNGDFHSVEVRGSRVYAGGHFLQVGTRERRRFATFGARRGRLKRYSPSFNRLVQTVDFLGRRLFVGGNFTEVNGNNRPRLARFSPG
jgi:Domain of unknown function (DUF5122) beta-propeller